MAEYRPQLLKLLENFKESKGFERITCMQALRRYVSNAPVAEIGRAIMRLGEVKDLEVLMGAGLREPLYSIALSRRTMILYPDVFV